MTDDQTTAAEGINLREVNVDDLPDVLPEVTDLELLRAAREHDDRKGAIPHFDRRIAELQEELRREPPPPERLEARRGGSFVDGEPEGEPPATRKARHQPVTQEEETTDA